MTPQELKASILQLAIQGKLVEQRPEEGTGEELLEKILATKNTKDTKKNSRAETPRRRGKADAASSREEIPDSEKPFDIPESWVWVHLNQIATSGLGKTLDRAKNTGTMCPYLCSINVYWEGVSLGKVKEAKFDEEDRIKYRLRKGDLLICEGGDVGRSAIWDSDEEMYYQNALHRVRFYCDLSPAFFKYVIECYKGIRLIEKFSKGTTIKHLVQGSLYSLWFPLPPLAEQKRIVAKIEELLPYIDRYEKAWSKLEDFNKRFPGDMQKSLLQMAIQGKLVDQRPEEGTGEELYRSTIFLTKKVLNPISKDEVPFDIPSTWKWLRHNELFEIIGGSQPPKSKFAYIKKDGYVRLYQIRDYGENPVPVFVPQALVSKFTEKGDILLARYGASVGKVFWAEKGAYNVAMAKAKPLFEGGTVLMKYAYYYYLAPLYQSLVRNNSRSAQAGFNKDDLNGLLFPLPPLAEQKRIVAKLEELLPLCERLK